MNNVRIMKDVRVYQESGIVIGAVGSRKRRRKTMAKNDYLSRQRAREQEVFDAGLRIGRQQMCDYISLALRDPETMGKDTFSGKRIIKVINKVNDMMCQFSSAFEKCDEADYYQEKLDRLLREAYGEEIKDGFFGFHDRYDCVKKQDYFTGKWK